MTVFTLCTASPYVLLAAVIITTAARCRCLTTNLNMCWNKTLSFFSGEDGKLILKGVYEKSPFLNCVLDVSRPPATIGRKSFTVHTLFGCFFVRRLCVNHRKYEFIKARKKLMTNLIQTEPHGYPNSHS